ncbi:DUF58 domain-containing protein [Halomicronema sp. CCY15110]|uniref:DUF58 domain-containing protein n=1 Tax=Halomicronema sp. CCY15110 TaxID=2767773 RepID=UPI00194E2944|nr:DUF58 domain-containing protein [Halomicronema sp. CCY15110]
MMMRWWQNWLTGLETRWVAPAYAGGVLLGLSIALLGAAVNSMAGWLYAMGGVMIAIALINIWAAPRSLQGLQVHRQPIRPISVGEALTAEMAIENPTAQAKVLLQVRDQIPAALGELPETAIATLAPHQSHRWTYTVQPTRRGVYQWQTVTLRTAAPFGLFWCQRSRSTVAHATVYPQILPLTHCPLIDQMGIAEGSRWQAFRQAQQATQGLTRAMRPYRWGDSTRLIHWRTSARYGDLRVRELEEQTADNQVMIGLDTRDRWHPEAFEAAIVAAASLYIYSLRQQLTVALWLPHIGLLQNRHTVLAALAEVTPGQPQTQRLPAQPLIWLGSAASPPLPPGSVWVQWPATTSALLVPTAAAPTLTINPEIPLAEQLAADLQGSLATSR